MKIKTIIKCVNAVILAVTVFAIPMLPFFFLTTGGSDIQSVMILTGYILSLVFSALGTKWLKCTIVSFTGILLMFSGFLLDSHLVNEENNSICLEMRNNPSCIENGSVFKCTGLYGFDGVVTNVSTSICSNLDEM